MNTELDTYWNDPKNWKFKVVYVCREDPRIVVSKKLKWTGWTFNFAHPASFLLLFAVIALAIGPIFWVANTYCPDISKIPYAVLFSIISISLLTIICSRIGRQ